VFKFIRDKILGGGEEQATTGSEDEEAVA
jgi:hypothetical protein